MSLPAIPPGRIDALRRTLAEASEDRQWRSLAELADTPEARRFLEAEFPALAELMPTAGRRDLVKVMGASLMLAGLAACDQPPEAAVPYVRAPENQLPGEPRYYATAVLFEGIAQPVLAETSAGRPIKLEGNPFHPLGTHASTAFTQAELLQFYDPDRSQAVRRLGRFADWPSVEREFLDLRRTLDAREGEGFALVAGAISSPSLLGEIERLRERWPRLGWYGHEPVGDERRAAAIRMAAGEELALHYRLADADTIVSLEEDLLGPGPAQLVQAHGWGERRRRAHGAARPPPRLFVAESTPSLTGAQADRRLAAASGRIPALTAALAQALGVGPAPAAPVLAAPVLAEAEQRWVTAAAEALRAAGAAGLICVGAHQDPAVQALGLAINQALGAIGSTLAFTEPLRRLGPDGGMPELAKAIRADEIDTAFFLDCNPAYTAPGDLAFSEAMQGLQLAIHAGLFYDETASHCHWHLPLAHPLESWGDARAPDGTVTMLQPTIAPLYRGRSAIEILAALVTPERVSGRERLQAFWQGRLPAAEEGERRWREILHDGFLPDSAPATVAPILRAPAPGDFPELPERDGPEVVFRADPTVWDGRFANSGWMQELPKPFTVLTWDNAIAVSPRFAEREGLETGMVVELADGDGAARVSGPVFILPNQAAETLTVFLGYGRTRGGGAIGYPPEDRTWGYDAYRLRRAGSPWLRTDFALRKTDERIDLATVQHHFRMEGHEFVRTVPPEAATGPDPDASVLLPEQPSLHPEWTYPEEAWAMAIDLDLCIGCNACVIACQAENNVPVVGKDQVLRGREMHWIRVDTYHRGSLDEPETFFQPVPCMHCEKAPCEIGCPVNATVHGPEGLNEMIYNRCVGTRTCAVYCPYKVRRFNYYDYAETDEPQIMALRNPDVTVRARGVMEKCTYCIQRINRVRIDARQEDRPIRDGEFATACEGACPTRAIIFGNMNDPESRVAAARRSPRHYALLFELGTRPRTTYLARLDRQPENGGGDGEGEGA